MPTRAETLLAPVPRGGRIIEIGPMFSPIAPKAAGWNTCTLDHLSREGLVEKYQADPNVDVSRIEEVDFVWTGGALSDAVPAALHGSLDAFVASHVIEHTPDLIAFLQSAAALLKPEGVVILAVPDKRYCFDCFQALTTTGQVLAAHGEKRVRHDRWLGFDFAAYKALDAGAGCWGQHPLRDLRLSYDLQQARDLSGLMDAAPGYTDLHAWRFTPSSFELLMLELAALGETDWRVERATAAEGCEFFAWLRRGGQARAAAMPREVLTARRLALLKQAMLETRAQIDWLLAGEPELVAGPLGLLPGAAGALPAPSAPDRQATGAAPEAAAPGAPRFVDWFPHPDNAGRAFEGEWSSAVPGLPTTGQASLFQDGRILWFEDRLHGFAGKSVLELGPLEGGHTHMMTQRGAAVLAIESNTRAWLRCLVAKDALAMPGATFLLGDFMKYLASSPPRVDFALASGVLYHMTDPVGMLQNLCGVCDSIGLWTHYFDEAVLLGQDRLRRKFDFQPRAATTFRGREVCLYGQRYLEALRWEGFCGGSAPGSQWLRKQDILGILEDEGFACETFLDEVHQNGPAFCVFGSRRASPAKGPGTAHDLSGGAPRA